MKIIHNVPGPSQEAFNTLNNQMATKVTINKVSAITISTQAVVSFTNGEGDFDMTSAIPSGYRISIPVCCPESTGSLSVTGCSRNNTNTTVHIRLSNQSYTGNVTINILATCLPIT